MMYESQQTQFNRRDWLKAEVKRIQEGGSMEMMCVMSTADRVNALLCGNEIPADRIARGQDTCSPQCQADKRRLKREANAQKKCRHCGHGFTKRQREQMAAELKDRHKEKSHGTKDGSIPPESGQ